jgi:hypothetical protein
MRSIDLIGRNLFRHPEIGTFFQTQPKLENPFIADGFLRRTLMRMLPAEMYDVVSKDLTRFGERVRHELEPLSEDCEKNPPYLVQFDSWGKRVDQIGELSVLFNFCCIKNFCNVYKTISHSVTAESWKTMKKVTAEEGIVAIGYDKQYGEHKRIYQFAKTLIFAPSSGLYSCPIGKFIYDFFYDFFYSYMTSLSKSISK